MKFVLGTVIAFAAAFAVSAASAASPAFDCAKASHEIETLICQNDELAAKDHRLADVFAKSLKAAEAFADSKAAISELKAVQRGWIGGRNDCWKEDDKVACTAQSYDMRISELQARFMLVKAEKPAFYRCDDKSEIVATFMASDLPTVRLERGDTTMIAWTTQSGSGSRYDGDFGLVFWIKGNEAQVEWPQGTSFACRITG